MIKGMNKKDLKSQLGLTAKRTASQESTASQSEATAGRFTAKSVTGTQELTITQYGQHLYNTVAALVICPKHKNVGLTQISSSKGVWLPFIGLKTGDGWYDMICQRLRQVLAVKPGGSGNKNYLAFKPPEIWHTLRLQIPIYFEFISRTTFVTELTYDPKYPTNCCESSNKSISWLSFSDCLKYKIKNLWGPEPAVFLDYFIGKQYEKGCYTEYTIREALRYSPRDPPKTYQEELLKAANFTEKDVIKVYSDFIQLCYPSQYMTISAFIYYMNKTEVLTHTTEDQMRPYFRSFAYNRYNHLTFHELLLGLAAIDKNIAQGGHTGELRCGYIFRYYNRNDDKPGLEYEDMKALTRDLIKAKAQQVDESKLESEVKHNYELMHVSYKEKITEDVFIKCVGNMQLRGTSTLLRINNSVLQLIKAKSPFDSIQLIQNSSNTSTAENKLQRAKGTCQRCRDKRYTIAAHTVRLALDGNIVDPKDNKDQDDLKRMPKSLRKMSDNSFQGTNYCNEIIDSIRVFAFSKFPTLRQSERLSDRQTNSLWSAKNLEKIFRLCSDAESVLKKEQRVVKVCSPCYVLGDIHGNLHDLIIYERQLWKMGPTCVATNYLFLGDYVDRGEYGLECILYLLSLKLLAPERFCLLRGNHELRPVQQQFTFYKECQDKLGNKGTQTWEALNKVFDYLPICAIIDDSIFCAHGGIPTSVVKIEELMKIPSPLTQPDSQSSAAWEMLWNDPVSNQEFSEYTKLLKSQSALTQQMTNMAGFLPNTKRGTAYYFSEEAVNKFLMTNQLSHIIRAHEVTPSGYNYHIGGKVITVFSSSKYCGGLNESACVLVDNEKIRIIIIDTNERV